MTIAGLLLSEADATPDEAAERLAADFPDAFSDAQGRSRILSALHAHQWPGLILKPRPGPSGRSAAPVDDLGSYEPPSVPSSAAASAASAAGPSGAQDDEPLDLLMGQLLRFKETAGRMTDGERRDAAEHMALRLLAALGDDSGDEAADAAVAHDQ